MRIDIPLRYKYFFQILLEEPKEISRYSLLLISIPLLLICILYNWNQELVLFIALGYVNATVGFMLAKYTSVIPRPSLKKRIYQKMVDEQLNDLVVFRDNKTHQIAYANTAFSKKLGFDASAVEGMWFSDFVAVGDMRLFRTRKSRKLSIQPFTIKDKVIRLKKDTGEFIWVEIDKKPVDQQLTMYTFKEVTQRIQQQKANRQLALELLERRQRNIKPHLVLR